MKQLRLTISLLFIVCFIKAQTFTYSGITYSITDPINHTIRVGDNNNPALIDDYSTKAIIIPSSITYNNISYIVTSIGNYAFVSCKYIPSMTLPSSVTYIGEWAFHFCSALTSINIPSSVTYIGNQAFENCNALTNINIPSSVVQIGSGAFDNCSALITVDANNPNFLSQDGVLYDKSKKTLIHCPTIISGSFTIPLSVTKILGNAFLNCINLTSITIPILVKCIESKAFDKCDNLKSIHAISTIPNKIAESTNVYYFIAYKFEEIYTHCTLYVPKGSKAKYQSSESWCYFMTVIEEDVLNDIPNINSIALRPVYHAEGTLQINGLDVTANIEINNALGKKLYSGTVNGNSPIKIGNLSNGIYLLRITNGKRTISLKMKV